METLKKRIVWIIVIVTILYFFLLRYFGIVEIPMNEIGGNIIGFLIIPLLLSLLRGLWDLIKKRFSWNVVKNTFSILWLFMMILTIIFSPEYGLFNKKENGSQLKELVRQYASEANSQRREYHYKLGSFNEAEIKKPEDLKNIDLLNQINSNITSKKKYRGLEL